MLDIFGDIYIIHIKEVCITPLVFVPITFDKHDDKSIFIIEASDDEIIIVIFNRYLAISF